MFGRKLIYIYLAGTFLAFIWIFNFSAWCTESDELLLKEKALQIDRHKNEKKQIDILKRQITELKAEIRSYEHRQAQNGESTLPTIYLITPTHARLEQKADLTRLSHTLRHVPKIHWIIVEDAEDKTGLVTRFLALCKIPYTHLNVATPAEYKLKQNNPNWLKPRGVLQRTEGLRWVRQQSEPDAVVYFADDDNTYDLQLFDEMRFTKKVSVWPVGLVGNLRYESPIVKKGKVTGWYTYWKPGRPFAMDMAGFAVNLNILKDNPQAVFRSDAGRGNLESDLLAQLGITLDDLEPRADNCNKVLVWHTRTEKSSLKNEEKMLQKYGFNSNKNIEV